MTVVTPTDHPKSVRYRCVIEVFGGVFVLSIGFRIFCWYRGFRHRSESDLLLFLLQLTNGLLFYSCWFVLRIYVSNYTTATLSYCNAASSNSVRIFVIVFVHVIVSFNVGALAGVSSIVSNNKKIIPVSYVFTR